MDFRALISRQKYNTSIFALKMKHANDSSEFFIYILFFFFFFSSLLLYFTQSTVREMVTVMKLQHSLGGYLYLEVFLS